MTKSFKIEMSLRQARIIAWSLIGMDDCELKELGRQILNEIMLEDMFSDNHEDLITYKQLKT